MLITIWCIIGKRLPFLAERPAIRLNKSSSDLIPIYLLLRSDNKAG